MSRNVNEFIPVNSISISGNANSQSFVRTKSEAKMAAMEGNFVRQFQSSSRQGCQFGFFFKAKFLDFGFFY